MTKPTLTKRISSVIMALLFLNLNLFPSISYGLTSGEHQPELSGYEEAGATDMVNLATGDLAYTIPLLNVPGPGGGFSLPLSYHSGIGLEQEASWVGLGWSMNPGAIIRNTSQYPDDFIGESIQTQFYNHGGHTEVHNYFGIYNNSYNSEDGKWSGSVGLFSLVRAGWGDEGGFSAMGINFATGDVNASGVFNSLLTVLSFGGSSLLAIGAEMGIQTASAAVVQGGVGLFSTGNVSNVNNWTIKEDKLDWFGFKKKYRYYIDQSHTDYAYGSLYAGEMSNSNAPFGTKTSVSTNQDWEDRPIKIFHNGSAPQGSSGAPKVSRFDDARSDMAYNTVYKEPNHAYYSNVANIAYDSYSVSAGGVSGGIRPYRVDMGSLSNIRREPGVTSIEAVPFSRTWFGTNYSSSSQKVQFMYPGEMANYYDYHTPSNGSGSVSSLLGIDVNKPATGSTQINQTLYGYNIDLQDAMFYDANQRHESRVDGSMVGNKLVKGRYVEWFTQSEINGEAAANSGFCRTSHIIGNSTNLIGGFLITGTDGTSYHFALSNNNIYNLSETAKKSSPTQEYSRVINNNTYAANWLLTGITGSDYVDINTNGEIDDEDWGYWVKLDYEKYSEKYEWRTPLTGYQDIPSRYSGNVTNPSDYGSYEYGVRESYYLNSIRTRTHTAIFIKDFRKDGKGVFNNPVYSGSNGKPSQMLLLDEIITLSNEAFDKLTASTGSGGYGFSGSLGGTASTFNLNGSDKPQKVYDVHDLAALSSAAQAFISEEQEQRIIFNYDYHLAPNTPNSYDFSSYSNPTTLYGRLSLNSIEMLGPNDVKLLPDYNFSYYDNGSDNFTYNSSKWDAWGMPSSNGSNSNRHASDEAGYWHLKQVELPTGLTMDFEYERDKYRTISGKPLHFKFAFSQSNMTLEDIEGRSVEGSFQNGDQIALDFQIRYEDISTSTVYCTYNQTLNLTVDYTSGDKVYFQEDENDLENSAGTSCSSGGDFAAYLYEFKKISSYDFERYGGDVRVSKVTVNNDGNSTSTLYRYTHDGSLNGRSSGVCSKEPPLIEKDAEDSFYGVYDYPLTSVFYSNVTVFSGYSPVTSSYLKESRYKFEVPNEHMVSVQYDWDGETLNQTSLSYRERVEYHINKATIKTAGIGRPLGVNHYNSYGEWIEGMSYGYTSEYGDMAKLSEGALITEREIDDSDKDINLRINRSSKVYYPSIPTRIILSDHTGTKTVNNTKYDWLTGNVLETEYYDSWGAYFKTVLQPAYKVYSDMASKYVNKSNYNMLSQKAASYLYTKVNNDWKALSGSVTTWDDNWNYRSYNSGSEKFEDVDISTSSQKRWRKKANYVWESSLNDDGSLPNFLEYDFAVPANNTSWTKTNEVTRYNVYSQPLESFNPLSGQYSSSKMDKDQERKIVSSSNTSFTEQSFISFEDVVLSSSDYKGMKDDLYLTRSAVEMVTNVPHTGSKALQLKGQDAIKMRVKMKQNKTYILRFWIHSSNHNYATVNVDVERSGSVVGTDITSGSGLSFIKAGNWYLASLKIDATSYTTDDELIVKMNAVASTHPLVVDDILIAPYHSGASCKVYNDYGKVVAELDGNHFATKYVYEANTYRLKQVYIEVADNPNYPGGFRPSADYHYNIKGLP